MIAHAAVSSFQILRESDPRCASSVDIVAVHGLLLGGQPWLETTKDHFGLADTLLTEIPTARIMVYGYHAPVFLQNGLEEAASRLIHELANNRQRDEKRPIILVGHGFGGIIAQQVLLRAHLDARLSKLCWAIVGAVFVRTPHRGHLFNFGRIKDSSVSASAAEQGHCLQACETLAKVSYHFRQVEASLKVIRICTENCDANYTDAHKEHLGILGSILRSSQIAGEQSLGTKKACGLATPLVGLHYTTSTLQSTVGLARQVHDAVELIMNEFPARLEKNSRNSPSALPRQGAWHPGTCEWILKSSEFRHWRKGSESNVLWITGKAGAGKSTLASFAWNSLRKSVAQNEAQAAYFCQGGTTYDDAKTLLECVAHQLRTQRSYVYKPASLEKVLANIDSSSRPLSTWTLRRHLRSLFNSVPTNTKLILVLDGLDECGSLGNQIVTEIAMYDSMANKSGCIKCLMTSRSSFSAPESGNCILQVYLDNNRFVEEDIRLFVRDKCRDLFKQSPWHQQILESLAAKVLSKAQGTFLWPSLFFHDLTQRLHCNFDDYSKIAEHLPPYIESLYQQRLDSIAENDRVLSSRLLKFIAYAMQPLQLDELIEALAFELPGYYDVARSVLSEDFILNCCGGLVIINEDRTVHFFHHSFREYICSRDHKVLLGNFFVTEVQAHAILAQACLQCLLERLVHQIADITSHDESPSNGWSNKPGSAFLRYATRFWSNHYGFAESQDNYIAGMLQHVLYTFIDAKFPSTYDGSIDSSDSPIFRNAIFRECATWGCTALVRIYLEMGIDVNTQLCPSGASALHCAAAGGHASTVELLLRKGALIDAQTSASGRTALHWASLAGDKRVVEILLEHRADLNLRTMDFTETPLHLAAAGGHLEVMKLLVDSGADVNAVTSITGETPLHLVAAYGLVDEASYLLAGDWQSWSDKKTPFSPGTPQSDSLLDDESRSGQTWSVSSGQSCKAPDSDIDLLYCERTNQHVDIGAKNSEGWTPLHIAAASGNLQIVTLLLRHGAEVNAKTFGGQTASNLAACHGHGDVSSALSTLSSNSGTRPPLDHTSDWLGIQKGSCVFDKFHDELDENDMEMQADLWNVYQPDCGVCFDGQDDWTFATLSVLDVPCVFDL